MRRSVFVLFLFSIADCAHVLAQAPIVKRTVIEIPFEFIHESIVVQATINGRGPFWMLLDSGADPSIVELGTAKSVDLKIAAKGQQGSGGGAGGNLAYETSLQLLQLGGLTALGGLTPLPEPGRISEITSVADVITFVAGECEPALLSCIPGHPA